MALANKTDEGKIHLLDQQIEIHENKKIPRILIHRIYFTETYHIFKVFTVHQGLSHAVTLAYVILTKRLYILQRRKVRNRQFTLH